jgi:penicillin amidase
VPTLRGPDGPIEYRRDELGYPSVRARDFLAGTWARGWFHARDRLVQAHLTVALARGRALELLGDSPLARLIDRGVRLHDFTGDLATQVDRLPPAARAMVDAYCAGFAAGARERGWPLVFRLLGLSAAPFRPEDVILTYRMISWFGLTSLQEWAEALVAELVAGGAGPESLALLLGDAASPEELAAVPRFVWPAAMTMLGASPVAGSNAIAIAASRSTTGSALLLGDPHMEVARIPPVLYAMHADYADGSYLQGVGIVGIPWPSFGRTPHLAFTYTYGHADAIDLRAVRCRAGEAWDGAAWRPLTRRAEQVKIKKRPAETWVFHDCELGTVVGDADAKVEATLPCFRWSGLRETWSDFDASCALVDRARNVDEAVRLARGLLTLSLHAVYADSSGRIASVTTGRVDRRAAECGGVLPRAPDGAPQPMSEETRPGTVDPPDGFYVSANERRDGPAGERWIPLPEPRYRHERLTELVAAGPVALGDLASFACDAVDTGARRLLAAWAPHMPDDDRAVRLVAWGAAQPGNGREHFAALTLFVALHLEATRALLARHLGAARAARLLDDLGGIVFFQHHVDDALALDRPGVLDATALRAILAEAWPRALARAERPEHRLPLTDRAHNAIFQGKLPGFLGFDSAPVTNYGGPTTPNQSRAVSVFGQRLVFGASGRYLADLGRPGGWYCIPGGASEQRFGPGYGRGLAAWSEGRFAPLGPAEGAAPSAKRGEGP